MAFAVSAQATRDPEGMSLLEIVTPRSKFAYLLEEFSRFGKIGLQVIPF